MSITGSTAGDIDHMVTALDILLGALAKSAPKPIPVEVPGVGTLHVLPLTVRDMDEQQAEAMKAESRPEQIARGVARILCDADGKRFPPSDELVQRLMDMPWQHSQLLMQAATGAADAGNA